MIEKEVFEEWLNNFELYDEKDGKVSDYLVMFRIFFKVQVIYKSFIGVFVLVSFLYLVFRVEVKKIFQVKIFIKLVIIFYERFEIKFLF